MLYTFLPDDTGTFVRQPKGLSAKSDQRARDFFEDRLVRSRLGLTLGPLVKPVVGHGVSSSIRFAGHRRIVDLRKCPDGWALLPARAAIVCTNEHICLPHDVSAYLIGRVSSYNNGLITATSFLDSGWDGIVKLLLLNTSARPVRLYLGFEVARLFFEETPGASTDTGRVGTQSTFYGASWQRILDDHIDPFPPSGTEPSRSWRQTIERSNDLLEKYAKVGLLALALAGGAGAVKLYSELRSALDQHDRVVTLEKSLAQVKHRAPVGGTVQVAVPVGRETGETTVALPSGVEYRGDSSSAVAVVVDPAAGATAVAVVELDGAGRPVVQLRVTVPNAAVAQQGFSVAWIYLP